MKFYYRTRNLLVKKKDVLNMKVLHLNRTFILAILAAIFGGYYSFLQDLFNLTSIVQNAPHNMQVAVRVGLSAAVGVTTFALAIGSVSVYHLLPKTFGFSSVYRRWFPSSPEQRFENGRRLLSSFVSNNEFHIYLATVSGEWDICRPFTDKELRKLFTETKCQAKILLAHPESDGLRKRCTEERDQDLAIMKSKIIHNTQNLIACGGDKCQVRWYLTPPTFHVIANSRTMHFSPFVDGIPGHDTRRYIVNSDEPLYKAFMTWFDETWEKALDPIREMNWVTKQARGTRAVFLDRDDTLIKDVCYFGSSDEVEIEVLPNVIEGIRLLSERGFRLIVVSNQQSVGLKINSENELALLTKKIKSEFEAEGIYFDAFYYCKHTVAQSCDCRKPRPGLFEMAAKDFNLDLSKCHFIGNSDADRDVSKYLDQLDIHIVHDENGFLSVVRKICSAQTLNPLEIGYRQ